MDLAERLAIGRRLWDEKVPVAEIAEQVGRTTWAVYSWRRKYDWPQRPTVIGCPGYRKRPELVEFVRTMWYEGQLSLRNIALLAGVSAATIAWWRARLGWPRRRPGRYRSAPEDLARRKAEHDRRAAARMLEIRTVRRQESTLRWRCDCGRLCATKICGGCNRRSPI